MMRLSSNLTLMFKIFLPVGWFTFFGSFAIVLLFTDLAQNTILGRPPYLYWYLGFFLFFALFLYKTIFQLKRVEFDGKSIFVTDYFRTARYSLDSIRKIHTIRFGILELAWIFLHGPGIFGTKIPLITKRSNMTSFRRNFPHLFADNQ